MRAIEPRVFTLSTTWTEYLSSNGSRKGVTVHNETSANVIRAQFPLHNNVFAASFDGAADYVEMSAVNSAPNPFTAMTKGYIRMRVYIDVSAADRALWATGDASAAEYCQLYLDTDKKLKANLVTATGTRWAVESNTALTEGEWVVVELRHDGVKPELRVNRHRIAQTYSDTTALTEFISVLSGLDSTFIAASRFDSSGITRYFPGDIDWFRIKDLSDRVQSKDICWYLIDEGSGTSLTDLGPHGDTATLTGAPAWVARSPGILLNAEAPKLFYTKDDDGPFMQRSLWLKADAGTPNVTVWETEETDRDSA